MHATLVVAALGASGAWAAKWNYDLTDDKHGPHAWGDVCATGSRQSPINFDVADVAIDCTKPPLRFDNYTSTAASFKVQNNGHSVTFTGDWGASVSGGGLEHTYDLAQMHLHWAPTDKPWLGSEHLLSHLSYPLEAHFVHKRRDIVNVTEALKKYNGLAVIGVMITIVPDDNTDFARSTRGWAPLIDALAQATNPQDAELAVDAAMTLAPLLPADTSTFYRYMGSLTTPPCSEAVVWTVLNAPVAITQSQFKAFQTLIDSDGKPMHNHRPVQPQNGRTVRLMRPEGYCKVMNVPQPQALRNTGATLAASALSLLLGVIAVRM